VCTSYHVFPDENIEMREIINQVIASFPQYAVAQGRIVPSLTAPVIGPDGPVPMTFGIQLNSRKGLLLNARSEGAQTSPLFSPMLEKSRCLVPANDFYEWTKDKKPHTFHQRDGELLYMAGFFLCTSPLPRFVIITREADDPVSPIHNRMPLLLPNPEYRHAWLSSQALAAELLHLYQEVALIDKMVS
jgi:putative SOS response-associated peptidase YedK